ncbi:hypothetical protein EVAR_80507_1 [Eumeta japonica]|uniref:Uncharacterized protein n=1 Tax=Eumeta variegata TaxID=151549 RepID=A0A4C1TM77_EUMVA|nr:hypothetical protein EVAR_80507_1 [Eumeta japonica]
MLDTWIARPSLYPLQIAFVLEHALQACWEGVRRDVRWGTWAEDFNTRRLRRHAAIDDPPTQLLSNPRLFAWRLPELSECYYQR